MLQVVSFIIFILIVAALVWKDRKKVRREGIVLIRRTKKGRTALDSFAKKHRLFVRFVSVSAIVVAIPVMVFGIWFLLNNVFGIFSGEVVEGVRLVLPWPTEKAELAPGFLLLPWWIWVIGVFSVMVPHEFTHGIICRLEKIPVKSVGWILLLFIPGAFVEPDDKELKKARTWPKIKMYAGGSFANLIVGVIAALLGFLLVSVAYQPAGVIPSSVIIGYPAANASMGGAIQYIEGYKINSPDDIAAALSKIPAGSNITIITTMGTYNITTVKHPAANISFIGISPPYNIYYESPLTGFAKNAADFMREILFWIFALNLGIGIVNLLPLKPLDGGLIVEAVTQKYIGEEKARIVVKVLGIFVLFLILFNLFGPILMTA
ncbi:site-2 protease family protein [archaeon]|nr:site-2 protease family protein [archaeon]